jgi:hypothetical protein
MNEYAFAKTCIKVAGLIILILGLTGLGINGLSATIYWAQSKQIIHQASDQRAISMAVGLKQATATTMSRIPGNIIQILVGMYLCRKYHRPLKWLMKDEPTIHSK